MVKRLWILPVVLLMALLLAGCRSNTFFLTVKVEGEGTVTPAEGKHRYNRDEVASLKASPAEGWAFKEWEGAVADSVSAETTIKMDSNQAVKAVFAAAGDSSSGTEGKPAYTSYDYAGEGFRVKAEGWNCAGLVGEWQWYFEIEITGYGTIAGSGTSTVPPRPDSGAWLTLPYSYTVSGILDFEEAKAEVSYIFEDIVNEISVFANGVTVIDVVSGTGTAVVKVVTPETSFVVSQTYFAVSSGVPAPILFGSYPRCD